MNSTDNAFHCHYMQSNNQVPIHRVCYMRRISIWSVGGAESSAEGDRASLLSVYPAPVSNFLHVFKFLSLRTLYLGKEAVILMF